MPPENDENKVSNTVGKEMSSQDNDNNRKPPALPLARDGTRPATAAAAASSGFSPFGFAAAAAAATAAAVAERQIVADYDNNDPQNVLRASITFNKMNNYKSRSELRLSGSSTLYPSPQRVSLAEQLDHIEQHGNCFLGNNNDTLSVKKPKGPYKTTGEDDYKNVDHDDYGRKLPCKQNFHSDGIAQASNKYKDNSNNDKNGWDNRTQNLSNRNDDNNNSNSNSNSNSNNLNGLPNHFAYATDTTSQTFATASTDTRDDFDHVVIPPPPQQDIYVEDPELLAMKQEAYYGGYFSAPAEVTSIDAESVHPSDLSVQAVPAPYVGAESQHPTASPNCAPISYATACAHLDTKPSAIYSAHGSNTSYQPYDQRHDTTAYTSQVAEMVGSSNESQAIEVSASVITSESAQSSNEYYQTNNLRSHNMEQTVDGVALAQNVQDISYPAATAAAQFTSFSQEIQPAEDIGYTPAVAVVETVPSSTTAPSQASGEEASYGLSRGILVHDVDGVSDSARLSQFASTSSQDFERTAAVAVASFDNTPHDNLHSSAPETAIAKVYKSTTRNDNIPEQSRSSNIVETPAVEGSTLTSYEQSIASLASQNAPLSSQTNMQHTSPQHDAATMVPVAATQAQVLEINNEVHPSDLVGGSPVATAELEHADYGYTTTTTLASSQHGSIVQGMAESFTNNISGIHDNAEVSIVTGVHDAAQHQMEMRGALAHTPPTTLTSYEQTIAYLATIPRVPPHRGSTPTIPRPTQIVEINHEPRPSGLVEGSTSATIQSVHEDHNYAVATATSVDNHVIPDAMATTVDHVANDADASLSVVNGRAEVVAIKGEPHPSGLVDNSATTTAQFVHDDYSNLVATPTSRHDNTFVDGTLTAVDVLSGEGNTATTATATPAADGQAEVFEINDEIHPSELAENSATATAQFVHDDYNSVVATPTNVHDSAFTQGAVTAVDVFTSEYDDTIVGGADGQAEIVEISDEVHPSEIVEDSTTAELVRNDYNHSAARMEVDSHCETIGRVYGDYEAVADREVGDVGTNNNDEACVAEVVGDSAATAHVVGTEFDESSETQHATTLDAQGPETVGWTAEKTSNSERDDHVGTADREAEVVEISDETHPSEYSSNSARAELIGQDYNTAVATPTSVHNISGRHDSDREFGDRNSQVHEVQATLLDQSEGAATYPIQPNPVDPTARSFSAPASISPAAVPTLASEGLSAFHHCIEQEWVGAQGEGHNLPTPVPPPARPASASHNSQSSWRNDEVSSTRSSPLLTVPPLPARSTISGASSSGGRSSTARGESSSQPNRGFQAISSNLARGVENLFGGGGRSQQDIGGDSIINSVRPRDLLPSSVIHSEATNSWVATVNTNQRALESNSVAEASRSLRAFSVPTEKQAICLARAWAPPVMLPFDSNPMCFICDARFAVFRRSCHCRNCGVCICNSCAIQWSVKRLPATYTSKRTSTVKVCKACDWLSTEFRRALMDGDHDRAVALHSTGNLNLTTPFAPDSRGEVFYPVHCAVVGGNLGLLQWLIDEHCCPLKSIRITNNGRQRDSNGSYTPILTTKGRSLLGIALANRNIGIVRYLVVEKRMLLSAEKDISRDIVIQNLDLVLRVLPEGILGQQTIGASSETSSLPPPAATAPSAAIVTTATAPAPAPPPPPPVPAPSAPSPTPQESSSSSTSTTAAAPVILSNSAHSASNNHHDASERSQDFAVESSSGRNRHENEDIAPVDDLDDSDLCIICCANTIDCVATPCGHQMCCLECGANIPRCPVCSVDCSYMRVFRP